MKKKKQYYFEFNYIAALLAGMIIGNKEVAFQPPTCLRHRNQKTIYNVQTM